MGRLGPPSILLAMAHHVPVSVDDSHDPGEVRESMSWYEGAKPVLGEETTKDRRNRLEEIRRLLLAIIPRERGKIMK